MLYPNKFVIVGMTTFNTEFLRISIPQLAKIKSPIFLILHNDNPTKKVSTRDIRKFGYRGKLIILNATENIGPMRSRLKILAAARNANINSDWFIFVDDDDLLMNVDVPKVSDEVFAIQQNMLFIKRRLIDLLCAQDDAQSCKPNGVNITVEHPHIGIVGTLIRTSVILKLGTQIEPIVKGIIAIDETLSVRPPEDIVMWFYLTTFAKRLNPIAKLVYINSANYIATALDSAPEKYGRMRIPTNQPQEWYDEIMIKYMELF